MRNNVKLDQRWTGGAVMNADQANNRLTQLAALRYARERAKRENHEMLVWTNGYRYAVTPKGEWPVRPEGEAPFSLFAGPIHPDGSEGVR
jgi:hypothetical protein